MPSAIDYGVDSVEEIVTEIFGLTGSHRGREYDMLCVSPQHNDGTPSCSVNLETGYWHCFSCGVGGDLAKLGAMALGRDPDDVASLLRPTTPEARIQAMQRKLGRISAFPARRKAREPLPDYEPLESHPDMTRRGFKKKTIAYWDLRWVPEQKLTGHKGEYTIKQTIAIPIKAADGTILCWCYRSTETSPAWQPRYLYTPGVEVNELWFGLQHHSEVDTVTIVEGALDAIWLWQCGFPALALLGSHMGDRKIKWLQHYKQLYLLPDFDNAGVIWQNRIGETIGHRVPMKLCQYSGMYMKKRLEPDGMWKEASDPEELFAVDIEMMHARAVTLHGHKTRQQTAKYSP